MRHDDGPPTDLNGLNFTLCSYGDDLIWAVQAHAEVLDDQRSTIRKALDDIGPAAETLGENTEDVVTLLKRADQLARTGQRLATKVDDPLLQILAQLAPQ
mgnify:CR=1 FL=1